MSRPVLPALAVLFLGWSTAAVAAETPPDEDAAVSNQDVQAKKKKKRKKRAGPAAHAPRLPGQDVHAAQREAQRRHAAKRAGGGQKQAANKSRSGAKQGASATRPGSKQGGSAVRNRAPAQRGGTAAQRSQASQPRTGVGAASQGHRPNMGTKPLPGRRGSAGGPVRRGAEKPGARQLPADGPRIARDVDRAPQTRTGAPARGQRGAAARNQGQRIDPDSRMTGNRGQARRDQADRGTANRGQRAEQGAQAERPRTQAPGTMNRRGGKKPAVVKVRKSKYTPDRWAPQYHRRGLNHLPKYHPQYWGSGVFLYSPPSHQHNVTVIEQSGGTQTIDRNADKPLRAVDRAGSFAIGLRGGSYMGRGVDGQRHADNGLGVAARFRPVEALGVEVAWSRHQDTWEADAARTTDPLSVSGQIFAFPWTRVSPYLSAGYTWTNRSTGVQGASDRVKGPHAGLGLELAIGDSAALGVEGRYTHYGQLENISTNFQRAGALQGTLGMNFYF